MDSGDAAADRDAMLDASIADNASDADSRADSSPIDDAIELDAHAPDVIVPDTLEAGPACEPGFSTCGPVPMCAIDTRSDPDHCGACGVRCAALPNTASTRCASSRCELMACARGFANPDGDPDNGCEARQDFQLLLGVSSLTLNRGGSATLAITVVRRYGYAEDVTLSPDTAPPPGITGAFEPAIAAFPSNLILFTVNAEAASPLGTTTITLRGTGRDGTIARVSFDLMVAAGGSATIATSSVHTGGATTADRTVRQGLGAIELHMTGTNLDAITDPIVQSGARTLVARVLERTATTLNVGVDVAHGGNVENVDVFNLRLTDSRTGIGLQRADVLRVSTVHLSTAGNDGTGDGTPARPYASIDFAYTQTESGDTLAFAPGVYTIREGRYPSGIDGTRRAFVSAQRGSSFELRCSATTGIGFALAESRLENVTIRGCDIAMRQIAPGASTLRNVTVMESRRGLEASGGSVTWTRDDGAGGGTFRGERGIFASGNAQINADNLSIDQASIAGVWTQGNAVLRLARMVISSTDRTGSNALSAGVYANDSSNVELTSSYASFSGRFGVIVTGSASVRTVDSRIYTNGIASAGLRGGALVRGGTLRASGGEVMLNSEVGILADQLGGTIVLDSGVVVGRNGNSATSIGGLALVNSGADLDVREATFDGNAPRALSLFGNGRARTVLLGSGADTLTVRGSPEPIFIDGFDSSTVLIDGLSVAEADRPINGALFVGTTAASTITVANSTFFTRDYPAISLPDRATAATVAIGKRLLSGGAFANAPVIFRRDPTMVPTQPILWDQRRSGRPIPVLATFVRAMTSMSYASFIASGPIASSDARVPATLRSPDNWAVTCAGSMTACGASLAFE
ncbi:MAG: right-handed parallel beta-helix repeat-containing protein [Polyangiales bacterium]